MNFFYLILNIFLLKKIKKKKLKLTNIFFQLKIIKWKQLY